METLHFQLVVIGAGPGGYAAAFRAADLGLQVLLIDKHNELGGVCLNRGCIPSKALLHLAKVIEDAESVSDLGVKFDSPTIDVTKIQEWKSSVISKLNSGIASMAKSRKVERITGTASFLDKNSLSVTTENGNNKISFDNCIIATGSRPAQISGLPNDPRVINSTGALSLKEIPKKMLVIGGGYIGLEMGSVYASLGSKITVAEFMPQLLTGADQDLVKPLFNKLSKQFDSILTSTKVVKISPTEKKIDVTFEKNSGDTFIDRFDIVLVSVGRKPNTEKLKLDHVKINADDRGFIPVNKFCQTEIPNIYAIGDITGDPMLAHKATHEGKVAAEHISGDNSATFEPMAIPAVIFTDPEIAWAGKTEAELKEAGIPYKKGEFPWMASGRAISLNRFEGKTKILSHADTGRIMGVGMVGPNAGDLIGEGMLAIEMGADAEDVGLTIHPHPSLTETFANAAEIIEGTITDLYIPKK